MRVLGMGLDVVFVPRIARAWRRFGHRFAKRILHQSEIDALQTLRGDERRVQFLAGRWAAKEAAFKALGPCSPRIAFPELAIQRQQGAGPPRLELHGAARDQARKLGVSETFVTISHDTDYAVAQVLLQGETSYSV